ncbi:PREDICTED: zinc finger CCCH domain-containing protein 6-like [Nelumbo nucifera]|nr:PREDICTED: zinc finger CCCH domain-containing protein 6-like [Nelumbo nucifera]XP_010246948.1 PREDICTED: zinc finger CCCH domain-containing protein 6-like [Nelumbo nucifera]
MRGSQKSKRVSWAPDVNLCQVRLFLSEDSPSQVGIGAQDHLQAKASWLLHSSGMNYDDHLPPGFEGAQPFNQVKKEFSQIPLIKWKCPPRFVLNHNWQVVAGEESKEAEVQNQREMRVLEAVYPRPSAIPPSPSVSPDIENYYQDDRQTPIIPITPIEDEEPDPSCSSVIPTATSLSVQQPVFPQGLLVPGSAYTSKSDLTVAPNLADNEKPASVTIPGVEPDVVAAASAVFTAIMRSNEQGSLIDHELLIKILSNPKLVEKLVTDYTKPSNPQITPKPSSPPMIPLGPLTGPHPVHISRTESDLPFSAAPATGNLYPVTNAAVPNLNPRPHPPGVVPIPNPAAKAPPVKDVNYYKSLIQQHGGERPEAQDLTLPQFSNCHSPQTLSANQEPVQSTKPKIPKPCIYFNSSRGCRHGANCAYQHDSSFQQRVGTMQQPPIPSAKRMKLDREITGRT